MCVSLCLYVNLVLLLQEDTPTQKVRAKLMEIKLSFSDPFEQVTSDIVCCHGDNERYDPNSYI